MPSPEMRDVISQLRQRKQARAGQPPPPLDQLRAAFAPGGQVHPMPGDVRVTEAPGAGVPAYWLAPPGVAADRVLVYLHGGGYSLGSLRSYGELAARLGRDAGAVPRIPAGAGAPVPGSCRRRTYGVALAA